MYRNFLKPLLDFLVAFIILLVALFPLLIIAILILVESNGP